MANTTQTSIEELTSLFANIGYPLIGAGKNNQKISLEQGIISALLLKHPRLVEGIPVVLLKNEIDYNLLKRLIDENSLWNEFGYLGEFAARYSKNHGLTELIEYCRSRQKPMASLSSYFTDFFLEFQKNEERRWNLAGAPSYSCMEKQRKRYHG